MNRICDGCDENGYHMFPGHRGEKSMGVLKNASKQTGVFPSDALLLLLLAARQRPNNSRGLSSCISGIKINPQPRQRQRIREFDEREGCRYYRCTIITEGTVQQLHPQYHPLLLL